MKYKVSIIIPVYGVEKYIEKCMDSVLNQTLKQIQIIIVDDETPDNSIKIIEKKIKNHWRKNDFKIIRKKENEGLAFARKTGLEYVEGEYIHHLDSDDYYSSNDILEKIYNKAEKEKIDLVICNYNIEFKNTIINKVNTYTDISNINYMKNIILGKYLGGICLFLIKNKSYIEPIYFDKITMLEDWVYTFQILFKNEKISVTNIPVINYVQREGSAVNTLNEKHIEDIIKVHKYTINFLKENDIYIKNVKDILNFTLCSTIYSSGSIIIDKYKKYLLKPKDIIKLIFINDISLKFKISLILKIYFRPLFKIIKSIRLKLKRIHR